MFKKSKSLKKKKNTITKQTQPHDTPNSINAFRLNVTVISDSDSDPLYPPLQPTDNWSDDTHSSGFYSSCDLLTI